MTRAADKRASLPYEVRGHGRYARLSEEEKRRRHRARAQRRKEEARARGEKVDKCKARSRPDKAAGSRPAGTAADTLVEMRAAFARRARLPAGRMLGDGVGLYSGRGMLLPFAPVMPWRGSAETLQGMPPSAAGGG
ncbi:MAG TPA: hypothetical protein VLT47_11105 [Anaeromyxobacteraceae bacterium]|nr:hypothetical protein [Anaeromyxobacteraceae bacterium]